jgi:peptidoglycan/xylan/chitin deacetylase (PgdA/CDA1 family)
VEIAIAVIARAGSSTLGGCLDALRGAGASPKVFEIACDGIAQARNRALSACTAEVLALVEDDVLVDRGWLRALTSAWEGAADGVAVIGGPLRAPSAPAWAGLPLLDWGDKPLDVELHRRTFHGGNVSLRADALRGAGGFWPAQGTARDWFSAEHHAQQALGAGGWTGRYEPAAAGMRRLAAEDLGATAVLRRRVRYGARMSAAGGGRAWPQAARALTIGTAGVLLAAVRGDRELALERAARVAENAGVLVGGPLAERDFAPTARRTPFRPSVPPRRRRRAPIRSGPQVLLYHRVVSRPTDPLGLAVSPAHFAEQLDVLLARRRVVPLEKLVAAARAGEARREDMAITFDDGYSDVALSAAPLLAERALPWTLFVSTGHVEEGRAFWWDEVIRLLAAGTGHADLRLTIGGAERAWRTATDEGRAVARNAVLAALQGESPEDIEAVVADLRSWAGHPAPAAGPAREDRPMTVGELQKLAARPGVAIGAHTRNHRGLSYAPEPAQRDEAVRSRDDLEAWLARPTLFSYPFGVPGADVDTTTLRVVREAGFTCAVLNQPGVLGPRTDRFGVPRRAVPDADGDEFCRWLARVR